MDESDSDLSPLTQRARGGDAEALAQVLARFRPALLGYVARRLGDLLRSKVEPDDIVQETAAAAVREFQRGPPVDGQLFGWLCHLADQRIVDAHRCHVRAQKRSAIREARMPMNASSSSRPNFQQLLQASMTTPSQACIRTEQEAQVLAAVEQLPPEQREALRLHFLQGLPSKEIARRLGKEDVTIRVMISRSVQKLRRMLG